MKKQTHKLKIKNMFTNKNDEFDDDPNPISEGLKAIITIVCVIGIIIGSCSIINWNERREIESQGVEYFEKDIR